MPAAKPTLGYPSRTAAVLALQRQGIPDREIAARMGLKHSTVAALAHSGMRAGKRRRRPADDPVRTVLLPPALTDALRPHAVARGITAGDLAGRLIKAVIDDELIDAVLDDRGGGG